MAFLHVNGYEENDGQSKVNRPEAQQVIQTCHQLVMGGLDPVAIGVVTPYAAQVRKIRRMLRSGQSGLERLEISSVDGFQGREKEVIVFSAVRANQQGRLGFLADWRRVNVAFTRPKRGLVVIGHRHTLATERQTWARWLQWASASGVIVNDQFPKEEYSSEATRALRADDQLLKTNVAQCANEENVLPEGWVQYQTPEGLPYYHHTVTSQTVWERPGKAATWQVTSRETPKMPPMLVKPGMPQSQMPLVSQMAAPQMPTNSWAPMALSAEESNAYLPPGRLSGAVDQRSLHNSGISAYTLQSQPQGDPLGRDVHRRERSYSPEQRERKRSRSRSVGDLFERDVRRRERSRSPGRRERERSRSRSRERGKEGDPRRSERRDERRRDERRARDGRRDDWREERRRRSRSKSGDRKGVRK